MTAKATWGLIGHGNIGKELIRQIGQPDVADRLNLQSQPEFIVNSKGIYDPATGNSTGSFFDIAVLPDVVFLALPSSDDGQPAYSYIDKILKSGKLAVTAEKGALANHFSELKQASNDFESLGITATVGGGTRLLHVAKEYCHDLGNITQIHLVLNGTLAAIMDWVAPVNGEAMPIEQAAAKAVELGYAEPGSESAAAIIRGEAESDIPKKLSIFCNTVGLSPTLANWDKFRFTLTDQQINDAISSPSPRRFIVSLYPVDCHHYDESDVIGGFSFVHDNWQLVGGFRRIDANPLFGALTTLTGPGNGMVIGLGPNASDGVYAVTGPGAGAQPTVNTMIDDYLRISRRGQSQ